MPTEKSFWENLSVMARILIAAASLSVIGVLAGILGSIFDDDTTLTVAKNHGPTNTSFRLSFTEEFNNEGDLNLCVLSGMPQGFCSNLTSYKDVSDCKSVRLYDKFDNIEYLPEGMVIYLYWGKVCNTHKPYGVIRVPANVKEITIPNLNISSENYEVYNMGVGGKE